VTRLKAMASTEPGGLRVVGNQVSLCRHLRSAGMYVYTDRQNTAPDADYDETPCWCLKTMMNFGPDDERVSTSDCRDGSRSCYQPI
jgi:hypothetical protein